MSNGLTFGTLLRRARRAAGLTQEEAAERSGVSARTISDMERGVSHTPHADTVVLLAEALGLQGAEQAAFAIAAKRQRTQAPHVLSGRCKDPMAGDRAPVPFVGRRLELALLDRHLAGQGPPVLLLAGEPGMGKTRLLHAAVPRAVARGWRVLEGGCQRRGGQAPYAPVLEALQRHIRSQPVGDLRVQLRGCAWLVRLLPELADGPIEPLPTWAVLPEQERRLMFEAVARFLTNVAEEAGALLLLDDLQWAGQDALDLLASLARAAEEIPLLVLGAYRDTDVRAQHALSVMLSDLAQAGLTAHRRLGPLAPEDATDLLDGLLVDADAALRARVHERAGGVPFFLVSCAQGLRPGDLDGGQDALPWAVEQSIRQRVAALPAGADDVLATAAVVGREVPRALLVTVTQCEESRVLAACEAACRARLLEEQGADSYRFVHDAIREVLEADLGAGRRARTHRRLAEALEQAPGEPPVALLAYHYERSGNQDKAVRYLEQAGDLAQAQAAFAAAERCYQELLGRLNGKGSVPDSVRVREKLAAVLATTARFDAALALLKQAEDILQAAGDLEGLGRVAARIGRIHYLRGTIEEGVACLQPLQQRLEAIGPSVGLAMLYTALAELNLNWGHWAQEVVAAERAAHVARLVGDQRLLARAEVLRGAALCLMSREEEGVAVFSEVMRLAETDGDLEAVCQALGGMAWVYFDRSEFEQSTRYIERALQLAEKLGNPVLLAEQISTLGALAFYAGEWDRARGYYARAVTIHRQIALSASSCDAGGLLLRLGKLSLCEGTWDEAYRYLEQARIIFLPQGKRSGLREAQSMLAEFDILTGQPATARARLVPLLDRAGVQERHVTLCVLPALAWAYLELGDVDQANRTITDAIRRARAGGYRLSLVDDLRVQALVALRQGRWVEAEDVLEEGLALARALPYPYGEGRLLDVSARLHVERSDVTAARERLAAALAVFRRLGARKDFELTEQLLARLG